MEKKKERKGVFTKWLEQLQQNSWELELIISGLALFGLLRLEESVHTDYLYFVANMADSVYWVTSTIVYMCIQLSIFVFIVNLLTHLFVRSLWIGAIGLRYVSGDFDFESLGYSKRFVEFYEKSVGSFDSHIQRLENVASVIFSFTFLLFFATLSLLLFFVLVVSLIVYIPYIFSPNWLKFVFRPLGLIHLVMGLVVGIDFILLGRLKKVKSELFAKVYFWVYRYIGWVTLSFIWRPLLLNFLDNSFTRKFLMMLVPYYLVVGTVSEGVSLDPYRYYPEMEYYNDVYDYNYKEEVLGEYTIKSPYYDDLREQDQKSKNIIRAFSLPSYINRSPYLEVFVKYDFLHDRLIAKRDTAARTLRSGLFNRLILGVQENINSTIVDSTVQHLDQIAEVENRLELSNDTSKKLLKGEKDSIYYVMERKSASIYANNLSRIKNAIEKSIILSIDGQELSREHYFCNFFIHPSTNEKGMLCFLPMNDLENGKHVLGFKRYYVRTKYPDTLILKAPFVQINN